MHPPIPSSSSPSNPTPPKASRTSNNSIAWHTDPPGTDIPYTFHPKARIPPKASTIVLVIKASCVLGSRSHTKSVTGVLSQRYQHAGFSLVKRSFHCRRQPCRMLFRRMMPPPFIRTCTTYVHIVVKKKTKTGSRVLLRTFIIQQHVQKM